MTDKVMLRARLPAGRPSPSFRWREVPQGQDSQWSLAQHVPRERGRDRGRDRGRAAALRPRRGCRRPHGPGPAFPEPAFSGPAFLPAAVSVPLRWAELRRGRCAVCPPGSGAAGAARAPAGCSQPPSLLLLFGSYLNAVSLREKTKPNRNNITQLFCDVQKFFF